MGNATTWTKATVPKGGRPKGVQNRLTVDVKAMIEKALHDAGGADYLLLQAKHNPQAFMALVGKLLPRDVNLSGTLKLEEIVDDLTAVVRARREAAAKALQGETS